MLRGLHNDANTIGAVYFTHTTEDNIAQLLLGAQAIVAGLGEHLRYQVNHNIGMVRLCTTLHIDLCAGALVMRILLFKQITIT